MVNPAVGQVLRCKDTVGDRLPQGAIGKRFHDSLTRPAPFASIRVARSRTDDIQEHLVLY
jgi:hypothetical protein